MHLAAGECTGGDVAEKFPAYQGDQAYVFVSYSHADAATVYPELERLHALGFNVWYDEGISAGSVWRDEVARRIENCGVFLLLLSNNACNSDNCLKELNLALNSGRALLAVFLEPTELPPGLRLSLSDRQAILKYELSQSAYQNKLETAIRERLTTVGTGPTPVRAAATEAAPTKSVGRRRIPGIRCAWRNRLVDGVPHHPIGCSTRRHRTSVCR